MCTLCLVSVFASAFIAVLAGALRAAILIQALRSWVPFRLPFGLDRFVVDISEPVVRPIRRALPYAGGVDFSPFVALILIQVVEGFAQGLLRSLLPVV